MEMSNDDMIGILILPVTIILSVVVLCAFIYKDYNQPSYLKNKFIFNQAVSIECGFFKGQTGIIRQEGVATKDERGYLVLLDSTKSEVWIVSSCITEASPNED